MCDDSTFKVKLWSKSIEKHKGTRTNSTHPSLRRHLSCTTPQNLSDPKKPRGSTTLLLPETDITRRSYIRSEFGQAKLSTKANSRNYTRTSDPRLIFQTRKSQKKGGASGGVNTHYSKLSDKHIPPWIIKQQHHIRNKSALCDVHCLCYTESIGCLEGAYHTSWTNWQSEISGESRNSRIKYLSCSFWHHLSIEKHKHQEGGSIHAPLFSRCLSCQSKQSVETQETRGSTSSSVS